MHLRYNVWQMISLHSLGGCVRIKEWVCTYQFPSVIASLKGEAIGKCAQGGVELPSSYFLSDCVCM